MGFVIYKTDFYCEVYALHAHKNPETYRLAT